MPPLLALILATVLILGTSQSNSQVQAPPPTKAIRAGTILIASPHLRDPNFYKTVVLICQHSSQGTVGLILNRPLEIPLSKALPTVPALEGTSHVLYTGGPVRPKGILMLFHTDTPPANTRKVFEEVYFGGNEEVVEKIVTNPNPGMPFRVYAGHASWSPGQLNAEIERGGWATQLAEVNSVFDPAPTTLWDYWYHKLTTPRLLIKNSIYLRKNQVRHEGVSSFRRDRPLP